MEASDRIIVALDVDTQEKGISVLLAIRGYTKKVKVGLEVITAGFFPTLIEFAHALEFQVFFDVKAHDIPNTVGAVCRQAALRDVLFVIVHASAGIEAMKAAVAAADAIAVKDAVLAEHAVVRPKTFVLAVTALTSMDDAACREVYGTDRAGTVLRLAHLAKLAGVRGLICSVPDLMTLRENPILRDTPFIKVCPGIRPAGSAAGDQKSVATPRIAVLNGADYMVIGRPITKPETGTVEKAVAAIVAEIEAAEIEMATRETL